jgi:hypothetical protein
MVLWRSALRALRTSFSAARSKFIFFRADFVGEGPVTEGADGNLKLSVHCTKLAEDAATQLGEHQREAKFSSTCCPGRVRGEGRRLLVLHASA